MFKVAIVDMKSGVLPLQTFNTREEADEYILEIAIHQGVKKGYIENTDTKEREIIEEIR
jgi:hypothetical protein